jgi:hypothetical protein
VDGLLPICFRIGYPRLVSSDFYNEAAINRDGKTRFFVTRFPNEKHLDDYLCPNPQLGQTPLRGAGDQYLSLVTSKKLRSVYAGGGGFRSSVVGVSSPTRAEIFNRPHPSGSNPFLTLTEAAA